MRLTVEPVDPVAFAAEASAVLREAWAPPALLYSPEYLGWQFSSPGDTPAIAAAAFDGGEPVGIAAAVPRRLRLGGARGEALVLSFVAVRPGYQGRGVAASVYATLLAAAAGTGRPVLAYAQPETPGRRALRKAFEAAGYRRQDFGLYRTYAHRPGPASAPAVGGVTCAEAGTACFLDVVGRCRNPTTLWSDPGPANLDHYRADPRGRVLAVVSEPGGVPAGAGMVVLGEMTTPQGIDRIALLESIFLPQPGVETLKALLKFAAGLWPDRVSTPTISVPNAWGLDAGLLRAAGVRATPAGFEGYLFTRGDGVWATAGGTNLEIL